MRRSDLNRVGWGSPGSLYDHLLCSSLAGMTILFYRPLKLKVGCMFTETHGRFCMFIFWSTRYFFYMLVHYRGSWLCTICASLFSCFAYLHYPCRTCFASLDIMLSPSPWLLCMSRRYIGCFFSAYIRATFILI